MHVLLRDLSSLKLSLAVITAFFNGTQSVVRCRSQRVFRRFSPFLQDPGMAVNLLHGSDNVLPLLISLTLRIVDDIQTLRTDTAASLWACATLAAIA